VGTKGCRLDINAPTFESEKGLVVEHNNTPVCKIKQNGSTQPAEKETTHQVHTSSVARNKATSPAQNPPPFNALPSFALYS
jgi:hypothetical protein